MLSQNQIDQFKKLDSLYRIWNAKINVISRKDIDNLYERHVLHSLAIAKVISFKSESRVLDVGTGGGFPGIPLAILFPSVHFHLVDSIGKKIKVVDGIVEELGLTNVETSHERAENIDGDFHFIVSRAVTRLDTFIPWVRKKVSSNQFNDLKNGIIYLKGGDFFDEVKGRKHQKFSIDSFFIDPFYQDKYVVHIPL